ncbi:hypothetical protein FJTKL_14192 [Diaporthe vaccinii]|uniref:Uncharacterized protein n=1 Tax=Diaporthe vaccinii TaxID=105482 RepID=A0ABR4E8I5_9PEZI
MAPTNELLHRIRYLEDVLHARAADTAMVEAELLDLKQSLAGLERTRSGIRGAIEDALSGKTPDSNTAVASPAPAGLIDLGVEGSTNADTNNAFAGNGNGNSGNLPAEEVLALALASMRDDLGPKGLVKFIIQAAVHTSGMDAEEVIQTALETVRGSELTVDDVVIASLQAARNSRNVSASEILRPAVGIAMRLGSEVPVIMKEVFVALSVRLGPSMLRSSLLSMLGCALGMGMTYREIEDLMNDFSAEVKYGALGLSGVEESEKTVRFSTPPETRDPDTPQPQQLQQPPARTEPVDHEDTLGLSPSKPANENPLEQIKERSPGPQALGDASPVFTPWPADEAVAQGPLHGISSSSSGAATAPVSANRRADDDPHEGGDDEHSRPSKKVKIDLESSGGSGK